jgi:tartrate dehydrogenase/decarboxylase/D-malate dehydrogenase
VLESGLRTPDMGGAANTIEVGTAIAAAVTEHALITE